MTLTSLKPATINDGQPFLGSECGDIGLTTSALRSLLAARRVRRMLRGVYVDAASPDTRALRAAALHLVKPPDATFYGPTVAFLFGVDAFPPKDRFNFVPQCMVRHHDARCTKALVQCREGYLPEADLMEVEGLLVTTPIRTTVDMLRSLWRPHALAAADAMAHAGLVTQPEVRAYIAPMRKYPGIIQARSLSTMIDPQAESPGESWQRLRLIDAGFPVPLSQIALYDRSGRVIAVLDNGYEELKVGMDYDGREFHDDAKDRRYDDGKRSYCREVLRWRLIIARYETIFGDDPSFEQQVGEWIGLSPEPRRW